MNENRMNPFPGLRPFETEESHLFFGRDEQVDRLLEGLERTRFVTVLGASGCGKSSLIRAGLLPALLGGLSPFAGEAWRVAIMRPGSDPLRNLAQALNSAAWSTPRSDHATRLAQTEVILNRSSLGLINYVDQFIAPTENLLVVVDQFEELFRFARASAESDFVAQGAAFVKLLLEAGRSEGVSVYVVISLRSDYLGNCDQFWDLPETIDEGQFLIPRLTRDQYRQTIIGPLANRAQMSPRLVNQLLNDIGGENSNQLPVFQHALRRTWDHWSGQGSSSEIDISDYLSIGGMVDALSLQADETLNQLTPAQMSLAERIFKSLTEKGDDNRELRRPSTLSELCGVTGASESEVINVIELFRREGTSFLMPPARIPLIAESLIDISHESLIRNWSRLRSWSEEERQSSRTYLRLAESAQLHERGMAGLLTGLELNHASQWRDNNSPTEAWASRYDANFQNAMTFLDESHRTHETELVHEERRRSRELKRTRLFAATLSILFVMALFLGLYAYQQSRQANASRAAALHAQKEAEKQRDRAETAQRSLEQALKDNEMKLNYERARKQVSR